VVLGNEPVKVDGKVAGRVTSGAYGPYIGASVAFAYLPVELSPVETEVEILVFGNWFKGKIAKGPLYDPKGLKVRT
jgi:glycine cleavage system aminomethyltransferase T